MSTAFDFYAVSAQIIPILFLALAIELRFYEWRPHHNRLSRANRLFVPLLPTAYVSAEVLACLTEAQKAGDDALLRQFGVG